MALGSLRGADEWLTGVRVLGAALDPEPDRCRERHRQRERLRSPERRLACHLQRFTGAGRSARPRHNGPALHARLASSAAPSRAAIHATRARCARLFANPGAARSAGTASGGRAAIRYPTGAARAGGCRSRSTGTATRTRRSASRELSATSRRLEFSPTRQQQSPKNLATRRRGYESFPPRQRSVARRSALVGRPAPRSRTATRSCLGGGGGE